MSELRKTYAEGLFYLTFTVVGWADVFTRKIYTDELVKNLIYCQKHKGLNIYAYVVMTNHIHLIAFLPWQVSKPDTTSAIFKHIIFENKHKISCQHTDKYLTICGRLGNLPRWKKNHFSIHTLLMLLFKFSDVPILLIHSKNLK